ncbi:hypothetical protein SRHO_G00068490 [Serrasalmus rhombeus]
MLVKSVEAQCRGSLTKSGTGRDDHLCSHVLQASKVQISGAEERKGHHIGSATNLELEAWLATVDEKHELTLTISSLSEEFTVSCAREVLQYRESEDPKVSQAGIEVRTGRRWRAAEAVDVAESRIWHKALVGVVTPGRAGLGSGTTCRYNKVQGKDRRVLVQ